MHVTLTIGHSVSTHEREKALLFFSLETPAASAAAVTVCLSVARFQEKACLDLNLFCRNGDVEACTDACLGMEQQRRKGNKMAASTCCVGERERECKHQSIVHVFAYRVSLEVMGRADELRGVNQ